MQMQMKWMKRMKGIRGGVRVRQAAVLLALMAAGAGSVLAYEVTRSSQSLGQQQSDLKAPQDAPQTTLRPHSVDSSLSSSSPVSTLRKVDGPHTVLREAEVPPQKLERTRELIQVLKAEPTPQNAISVNLPADVLFDFDKADLRPDAAPSLANAAELIESYPNAPITVRGHTDGKGSDAYNDALSQRRAQSVAQELQKRTHRQATTKGLGRREPVAPNAHPDGSDDPQGRQLNRRVQILIGVPERKGG